MADAAAVDNLASGSSASSGCAQGGLHIRAAMRVSRVTFTLSIKRRDVGSPGLASCSPGLASCNKSEYCKHGCNVLASCLHDASPGFLMFASCLHGVCMHMQARCKPDMRSRGCFLVPTFLVSHLYPSPKPYLEVVDLEKEKECFNTSFGIVTYRAVESPGPFLVTFGRVEKSS